MTLRFLGTSAGELYPGLWCRCAYCGYARAAGGRNLRQSAAATVANDTTRLLIDFPSEIAAQAGRFGVDLPSLEHLLVTHSHGDHWFPYLLRWRARPSVLVAPNESAPPSIGGPRFTELPTLHIYGNAAVGDVLRRELGENLGRYDLAFHEIAPGETFPAGSCTIHALLANHDVGREDALHYVIEGGGKILLYGLDGDSFLPETRRALHSFRFDAVVLEATYGAGDGGNHRNFARVIDEARWLRDEGLMTDTGQVIASHFSPHHCPPHDRLAETLASHRIEAAWDGWETTL